MNLIHFQWDKYNENYKQINYISAILFFARTVHLTQHPLMRYTHQGVLIGTRKPPAKQVVPKRLVPLSKPAAAVGSPV